MKNKTLLLVLALFALVCASAWAQVPTTGPVYGTTPTGAPSTSGTGAAPAFDPAEVPCKSGTTGCVTGMPGSSGAALDVLGGHGSRGGCMFCHTPHSTGRLDTTAVAAFNGATNPVTGVARSTVAGGPYGSSYGPFVWSASSVGNQVSGNLYLWNRAVSTVTYKTWDGSTFSSATATGPGRPEVHSLLCMTCHDNSMSGYAMTLNAGGQHGGWGAPVTTTNGSTSTVQDPGTTAIGSLNGSGVTVWGEGDLSRTHPVHAKYSGSSLWKVTKNADGTVSYVDQDTNQIGDSGFYGHPARLYTDGTDVYVECTSCHNPHRQTSPAYKAANGTYVVGAFGTTENYIRGPFSATDGTISAGFCRSCHYSKSPEYIRNNGVAK